MDVSASEATSITRRNSDEDVVFYMEESRSGETLLFLNPSLWWNFKHPLCGTDDFSKQY